MKILAIVLALASIAMAQEKDKCPHEFKIDLLLPHTPIRDQASTGTCWSFGTTSFFEAELLRLGRGEFDLSEMFVVRHVYSRKAVNYVRYHGNATFGEGSLPFDWVETVKAHGIVPESVYNGQNIGEDEHDHSEMYGVLNGVVKSVIRGRKLTPRWHEAFEAVVDVYMGKIPPQFEYQGKTHTAQTFFREVLTLDLSDYVEITSFAHHPFYEQTILEIPDNWAHHRHYYNVPVDELECVIDSALNGGYTVAWDGDVSEKTFYRDPGYAVIPVEFKDLTEEEKKQLQSKEDKRPEREKEISQDMRQQTFDNYITTDDHLMHMIGVAHNQNGAKFYCVKNSWGKDYGKDGYWYLSRPFVRLKTIAILVHKDAVPQELRAKLHLR